MSDFKVTMWGVRGSHAMPGESTIRYGGNTTSILVEVNNRVIIIDAGTGIIGLGKKLMEQYRAQSNPIHCTILFTHMHHDHNQGLPFFRPMYLASSKIFMFGHDPLAQNISSVLFESPYFPVDLKELPALKVLHSVTVSDVIHFDETGTPRLTNSLRNPSNPPSDDVHIKIYSGKSHPRMGIFMYRINYRGKSLSICTDTEGYIGGDSRVIQFVRGSDLLIHDAQYTEQDYIYGTPPRQGFGHSTPEMAIEVAKRAAVKKLVCTHHDPDASDDQLDEMEHKSQALFAETRFARERDCYEL